MHDSAADTILLSADALGLRLALQGAITVDVCRDLRQAMLQALEREGDIRLSAAGVEQLDAAALQLLVAFRAAAQARGRIWRLEDTSASFDETVSLAGARGAIGGAC